MPGARGLFRRAIPQSGAAHHVHTPESAARVGRAVLESLGVDVDALAQVPVDRLLAGQAKVQAQAAAAGPGLSFAPMVDGDALPVQPLETARATSTCWWAPRATR
jgi:carboxylesterase type B